MRLRSVALAGLVLGATVLVPVAAKAALTCFDQLVTIAGTDGSDEISGTPGRDVIFGGRGGDVIRGGDGDDLICGGSGENEIYGEGGHDRLDAGKSTRATLLDGGAGNDFLYDAPGGAHAQTMYGGDGNDVLKAGASNLTYQDYLDGGPGDDLMEQGYGPATFVAGDGDDVMRGGGRHGKLWRDLDVLDMRTVASAEVDLPAGTATGAGADTVENFEAVFGGNGDDVLRGDEAGTIVVGGGGNDVIDGGGGDDCLVGVAVSFWTYCWGLYQAEASSGDDSIHGGPGDDRISGGDGDDDLSGGSGFDTVTFEGAAGVYVDLGAGSSVGEGVDELAELEGVVGSGFPDSLTGSGGDDSLDAYGGEGDVLHGLGGDDTLTVAVATDADGGPGADTARYAAYVPMGRDVVIDLRIDSDTLGNRLPAIENVRLELGAPTTIHGDDRHNVLRAGNGPDEVFGHGGDDELRGGYDDDFLDGGDGTDLLVGGSNLEGGEDECVNGETVRSCERS